MAQEKSLKPVVQKLKRQVSVLRHQEKAERTKLRAALRKVNILKKKHKMTLSKKSYEVNLKLEAAVAVIYNKLIKVIQRKVKKKKNKSSVFLKKKK